MKTIITILTGIDILEIKQAFFLSKLYVTCLVTSTLNYPGSSKLICFRSSATSNSHYLQPIEANGQSNNQWNIYKHRIIITTLINLIEAS